MSYILDALRRSQSERERGQVPGLHAQPVAAASVAPAALPLPARWVAVAAALVLALAASVWLLRAPATGVPTAAPTSTPPLSGAAPARSAGGDALRPPVATPSATSPTLPTQGLPPAAPAAPPAQALPQVVSAPPVVATAPPARTPQPTTPPTAAAAARPAPAAAAGPARVPALAELSADQRRELPPLALGGSVWSANAASRFVIVNGQVVREGEAAAPGVTVERIGQKAAVLRWRELRFEVAY